MVESYIPVVLCDFLMLRSPCFHDLHFAALAGNPVDHPTSFRRVDGDFGRTKCAEVSCRS